MFIVKNFKAVYIAGFIGALFSLIASLAVGSGDAIQNTSEKIRSILQIEEANLVSIRICLMIFILLAGALICWIYEPANRVDAFFRGISVLALLSLAPNVKDIKQNPVSFNNVDNELEKKIVKKEELKRIDRSHLFVFAKSTDFSEKIDEEETYQDVFKPNATIINNEWISSCRPSTSILSFFLNTITICKTGETLATGEKIEVLSDYYDTPSKHYRYLHIKYQAKSGIKDGWIYSGRDPDYFAYVQISDETILKKKL